MKPWRRRTVKGLIVLGTLLAFLSVFAIWVERQALDTGEWVNTSGHLIQNKTIRTALGEYMVEQLYENVDVEKKVEEILPGETKELAGPAASGLRQVAVPGSPGWSESGGPWVPASQGMKKYVWSVTYVEGGQPFTGTLAHPRDRRH